MTNFFKYIVAKYFFKDYAPTVMNWKNKMAGKSGRGQPLDFSEEDKKAIQKGFDIFYKEYKKATKAK